jgi:hypothetical protein
MTGLEHGDVAKAPALPPVAGEPGRTAPLPSAVRLGIELALTRLYARRPLLSCALALALALAAAFVEVSAGAAGAVDRALLVTFRLVVPLVVFALASDAADRTDLRDAAWPVARFGASSGGVAFGVAIAAALAGAGAAAVIAALTAVAAHTAGAPPLARDALVSAWVGALAGAAYAGWFSLGGTFLRRGRGRLAPLVADLLLGGSTGVAGALLPRGSAVNLLGGQAPLGLTQPGSAWLLAASALVLAFAAAVRCRD